ncbi:hypothetical protein F5B22DRAFT_654520 [Xylaria bambusicola]|uniref:uncharacterized protein n=1 Tax=Xylaria bambusicola TaxID=326684 RepID=UPI002007CECC|nr:uncharacterized protein F5B22DRAFT_654520 [Xylaria bambusicola]KAI0517738.1 hypothetical protein F5B22DRAFT_654520 [Xylaria bambusicola]
MPTKLLRQPTGNPKQQDPDSHAVLPHSEEPENPQDYQHSRGRVRSGSPTVPTTPREHLVTPTVPQLIDNISVACLDRFRTRMLPHFPFIHLPQRVTAEELCYNRPLLFKAIACVAWPFSREREARALDLKRGLCEEAFLRQIRAGKNQSNDISSALDLLLALMTYISWG